MLLADVVAVSNVVAVTPARSAKVALIADCLRAAGVDDVEIAASYLAGELLQRRTGAGWATLQSAIAGATAPQLTLRQVDAAFATIAELAGPGSQGHRAALLGDLFAGLTPPEAEFVRALAVGELRQGALDGVMVEAIAKAGGVALADVRAATMLRGALPPVARAALADGTEGLRGIGLQLGRPVQPMLAQAAASVGDALVKVGSPARIEWKFDGIRVQVHRDGVSTRVYSRSLDDITGRVPEIVAAATAFNVESAVFDGEAIALDADGRPRRFQETASRASGGEGLSLVVFDVMYLDGRSRIRAPAHERLAELQRVVPLQHRAPHIVTGDVDEAEAFFADALAHGHEGVVVKAIDAPYEAGRRGAAWVKVKPRHTLDLVVLAVEWGYGRRRGKLSNIHLGARDDDGNFVMLGKTFKGMTDEMLEWQTGTFPQYETHRDSHTIYLRPQIVVEIAFDGVQTSTRYPGGMALRFARVVRYRPDKAAGEADHIDAVRAIHSPKR